MNIRITEDINDLRTELEYFLYNDNDEMIKCWNRYCAIIGRTEDFVYYMYNINEVLASFSPYEIICMTTLGSVDDTDEYFTLSHSNTYLETSNMPSTLMYMDKMIDYIIDNDNDLDSDNIRDILDKMGE